MNDQELRKKTISVNRKQTKAHLNTQIMNELKTDVKKLVGLQFDDYNRVIRYERRKYDINIESLIDENYG